MTRKSMIGLAVASTLGLSAAAFAGTGHEVAAPFSPNESGENALLLQQHRSLGTGFSSRVSTEAMGSTSSHAYGSIGGSSHGSSHTSESSSSTSSSMELRTDGGPDHRSSLMLDDSFAAGDWSGSSEETLASADGTFGDYYVVTLTPVVVEHWDLYVIGDGASDELASSESAVSSSFEMATSSSGSSDASGG